MAVGDRWEWQGDLLNVNNCSDIVATFRLEEIVDREGETCARIRGQVGHWPESMAAVPVVECEVLFSISRGLPLESRMRYASALRTEEIRTRLVVAPAGGR